MPGTKAQPAPGGDPVVVDPAHYKLESENEHMRVLRVGYGPREKSVHHSHPDFVGVFLTEAHIRFTRPDGTTEDRHWKPGDVQLGSAGECYPENLADNRNELILFELKPQLAATHTAITDDPIHVDGRHYKPESENERVRVLRVNYGAHEKSTMHGHPATGIVFLTDYHVRFSYPDGRTEEMSGKAGGAGLTPAVRHLPENLEDQPMQVVLVEIKS